MSFELRFCAGSNPARGVSEIRDGKDLWQWSRLEIRLNTILRSTIPQKQFIIIIIIIIMHIVFLRKMFFQKNLEHLDFLHSWTYNGFLLNLKSVKKLLRKKLMGKITDWFLHRFISVVWLTSAYDSVQLSYLFIDSFIFNM